MSDVLIEINAICTIPPKSDAQKYSTHPLKTGYRASLSIKSESDYGAAEINVPSGEIHPGETATIIVRAIVSEKLSKKIYPGMNFDLLEHPLVSAKCQIIEILKQQKLS